MANGITTKQMFQSLDDSIKDFKQEIKDDIKDLFTANNSTSKIAVANEKGLSIVTKLVIGLIIVGAGSTVTVIITLITVILTIVQ